MKKRIEDAAMIDTLPHDYSNSVPADLETGLDTRRLVLQVFDLMNAYRTVY